VSKARSFSQAARTLGISGSLVSRHVAELERATGVRLVNRTARTISLTEAGARYAEFAARILDEIDREEASLRGLRDKAEGSLAVISPKWIGSNDVGDAIVAFSVHYPKIHIRFEVGGMSERSYEFLDQGFDVAFHTRHVRDCNLMLGKIADLEFALCASPEYLRRAGAPADPGLPGAGPPAVRAALPGRPDSGPGPAVPRLRHRLVPPSGAVPAGATLPVCVTPG
jgi:DNA-binding transcriptional LysR family regulator